MNLVDRLRVRQVGRSNHYEVVIDSQAVSTNLRDVGIGISQVLPVLTVAFFAPPGSSMVPEEPEIHLHSQPIVHWVSTHPNYREPLSSARRAGGRTLLRPCRC